MIEGLKDLMNIRKRTEQTVEFSTMQYSMMACGYQQFNVGQMDASREAALKLRLDSLLHGNVGHIEGTLQLGEGEVITRDKGFQVPVAVPGIVRHR